MAVERLVQELMGDNVGRVPLGDCDETEVYTACVMNDMYSDVWISEARGGGLMPSLAAFVEELNSKAPQITILPCWF